MAVWSYDETGLGVYDSALFCDSGFPKSAIWRGDRRIPIGIFGRRVLNASVILKLPAREIVFPRRPLVMGIVNVNDDSFSGDGTLEIEAALAQAKRQAQEGADIIDVGAESARTNRAAVAVEEEVRRFREFLARWPEKGLSVAVFCNAGSADADTLLARMLPDVAKAPAEAGNMDLRTYGVGAQILRHLGVRRMKLLGAPRRMPSMTGYGLEVTGFIAAPAASGKA